MIGVDPHCLEGLGIGHLGLRLQGTRCHGTALAPSTMITLFRTARPRATELSSGVTAAASAGAASADAAMRERPVAGSR